MITRILPLAKSVYSAVDGTALTTQLADLKNGFIDDPDNETSYIIKRPGFTDSQIDTTGPVRMLYWWANKKTLLFASYKYLYYSTWGTSGWGAQADLIDSVQLQATPWTWTTDGTYFFIADGTSIAYTNGVADIARIADGDAPTAVTHVAYLDGYILANNVGSNYFYWSNLPTESPAGPLNWDGSNYASASGDADYITALDVLNREVFLFGPNTMEIWENDGITPFSRVSGGFIQQGISAPYSILKTDSAMYWLDDKRRFMRYSNRQLTPMSSPYDHLISDMVNVNSCRGWRMVVGGHDFLVWQFPSADKTLVLNLKNDKWSEWTTWDTGAYQHRAWSPCSYAWVPEVNQHLVGTDISGIYNLTFDSWEDSSYFPIHFELTTGNIDYGTSKLKRNEQLRLRVSRGKTGWMPGTSHPYQLRVKWRDDGSSVWSNEHVISLGEEGQTDFVVRLHRLGTYRSRQWQFSSDAEAPLVILQAEEDLEVLR